MKKCHLEQVTSPLVQLQYGGKTECTKHITNTKINPNFPEDTVISLEVVRENFLDRACLLTTL